MIFYIFVLFIRKPNIPNHEKRTAALSEIPIIRYTKHIIPTHDFSLSEKTGGFATCPGRLHVILIARMIAALAGIFLKGLSPYAFSGLVDYDLAAGNLRVHCPLLKKVCQKRCRLHGRWTQRRPLLGLCRQI